MELLSSLRQIGETTFTGANEIERQPVTKPCVQTNDIRPVNKKKVVSVLTPAVPLVARVSRKANCKSNSF